MKQTFLLAFIGVAMLSTLRVGQVNAQIEAHLAAGYTDGEVFGAAGDLTFSVLTNAQAGFLNRIGLGVAVDYLGKVSGGGNPCPPSGDPPCPDGSEFIPTVISSVSAFKTGSLTLRAVLGGGVAIGSSASPDGQSGTSAEARTAPAVVYGAAFDFGITGSVGVFAQYRGHSIFTGERDFVNSNGPFTADVGTESKWLLSAGLAFQF